MHRGNTDKGTLTHLDHGGGQITLHLFFFRPAGLERHQSLDGHIQIVLQDEDFRRANGIVQPGDGEADRGLQIFAIENPHGRRAQEGGDLRLALAVDPEIGDSFRTAIGQQIIVDFDFQIEVRGESWEVREERLRGKLSPLTSLHSHLMLG